MSKSKKLDHVSFWQPSIEKYWSQQKSRKEANAGFPCFCAVFLRAVAKGEEGAESSQILEDLIYMFPNNVPEPLQSALVGALISFGTWSRLNLGSIMSSFTWKMSEIAISPVKMSDGNYILFALKMPRFFTAKGVYETLMATLRFYRMMNETLSRELGPKDIAVVRESLKVHNEVLKSFTFDQKTIENPFCFGNRPFACFESKSAMVISTQLFEYVQEMSVDVLGCAMYFDDFLVLSSMPHEITSIFPVFKKFGGEKSGCERVPVWIPAGSIEGVTETTGATVSITKCERACFFVLVRGHLDVETVLGDIQGLLGGGLVDFARECAAFTGQSAKGTNAVVFWPETGIARSSLSDVRVMKGVTSLADEFKCVDHLQELVVYDGERQAYGVRFREMQIFVEMEAPKGLDMDAIRAKRKDFVPNLPPELDQL